MGIFKIFSSFLSSLDTSSTVALGTVLLMLVWTTFLIYDYRLRTLQPSLLTSLGLYLHLIPVIFLFLTCRLAQISNDTALIWFWALLIFRYWRTLTNIFFWFRYRPALSDGLTQISPDMCTVIVPTVGPAGNKTYSDMVAAILVNKPSRLIFSTNTEAAAEGVKAVVPEILSDVKSGLTIYQVHHNVGPLDPQTEIIVLNAQVSNKRQQVVHAFSQVETDILVMVDDTAIWNPDFLQAALPAFDNSNVGFVGTRKWVKRQPRTHNPNLSLAHNLWNSYWTGFWNCMGGLYLIRYNFEIRATNAADGGVFCVSGRSSLIRSAIVNNAAFKAAFLNGYVLQLGERFPGWGSVNADDDNFVTRWVVNGGWDVKMQLSAAATMTTAIGQYPDDFKFVDQCLRWSRTTFRQNPIALFVDRTPWWKWPLTTWTTLFPWMYNAALVWDSLAVYALRCTHWYQRSAYSDVLLSFLIALIWSSKLVKTIPWFWAYPSDFFLYFLFPAYPLFAYFHSLLKIYTAFTFWDLAWSGRRLPREQGRV